MWRMVMLSRAGVLHTLLVLGILTSYCLASYSQDGPEGADGTFSDGEELQTNGRKGSPSESDAHFSSETDRAELRKQLVALIDALLSQPPTSRERSRRSPTTDYTSELSEYFDSYYAWAYGNCTCRGDPGPTGPQGIPGRDGRDGRDATPFWQGQGNHRDVTPLTDSPSQATSTSDTRPSGSGVYVRWGRTVCREGSELVYQGVIAGSHYDSHSGGGSNYLCLPHDPIYDLVKPGVDDWRAYLHGAEMEIRNMPEDEWNNVHDQGPPCAVCLALQRPTVLMVPARNVCPSSNWTLEYKGQLMAAYHGHKRTEHICVDRSPESIPRTAPNANGALLYLVEGACSHGNSLPCGPYINGHELTCAVCSM